MKFPFLAIFVLLLITLTFLRNRSTKSIDKIKEDFIRREQESNGVRKQDVSNLDYITIPDEILSLHPGNSSDFEEFLSALKSLADKKILNLNGISNTDLKMTYGVANLEFLSKCDNNYTTLIATLANYGQKLFENDLKKEGCLVLEYSVNIQSDVLKSYELLYNYYVENGMDSKIADLRQKADSLNSIRKDSILKKIS